MYGEWSCTRVNCLVSWDIQTRLLTDGFWLPGLIATRAHELDARQSGARTLYFERSTPCSIICRWIFRSEARLVIIPSINSVRQHDWLQSMNNIQVYHTKYGLQSTNSAHNTTAPWHALQVIQVVISMPTDPPGFTMGCVYCIQSSGWWNRITRRGNGWIHDIHRCWRPVDFYSVCE